MIQKSSSNRKPLSKELLFGKLHWDGKCSGHRNTRSQSNQIISPCFNPWPLLKVPKSNVCLRKPQSPTTHAGSEVKTRCWKSSHNNNAYHSATHWTPWESNTLLCYRRFYTIACLEELNHHLLCKDFQEGALFQARCTPRTSGLCAGEQCHRPGPPDCWCVEQAWGPGRGK